MKIKKIDIRAFRLFHEETVHLTAKKDISKPANFVAVYAPNGFGKTSFFDAMEFCMTGKIHRLADNLSENASEDKKQSGDKSFIHNKDYPEMNVSIKMEFDDRDSIIRTCRPDEEYHLLQGEEQNSFFSEAILSQDFFSSFISNKNAKQRFELFTQRFNETNGLLDYRQWLKAKCNSLGRQIAGLSKDIKSKELQINKELNDIDIRPIIKELVDAMKSIGYEINIEDSIPDIKIEKHRLQASVWLESCNKKIDEKERLLRNYSLIKNGTEVKSIYELLKIEEEIKAPQEECSRLKIMLKNIRKYKDLKDLIAKTTTSLHNLRQELQKVDYLAKKYGEYAQKYEFIRTLNLQLSKYEGSINVLKSQMKSLCETLKETGITIDKSEETRIRIVEALSVLSERYRQMQIDTKDLDDKRIELILLEDAKEEKEKERKKLIELNITLHELLEKCNQRKADLSNGLYFDKRKEIVELANQVSARKAELVKVNESIGGKNKYLKDIDQLITRSRDMVSRIEGGICPLCGFDYQSHDALLQSISSNTIINESLEKDIQTRDRLEAEISQLSSSIETKYSVLNAEIEAQIDECHSNLTSFELDRKKRLEQIKQLSNQIQDKRKKIESEYSDISNISEEKKRELLNSQKTQLDNEIKELKEKVRSAKENLEALDRKESNISNGIEKAAKELSAAKSEELYLQMTEYSTAHNISKIDKAYLLAAADQLGADIAKEEKALETYNSNVSQFTVNPDQEEIAASKLQEAETKMGHASLIRSQLITTVEEKCNINNLGQQDAKKIIEIFEGEFAIQRKEMERCEKERNNILNYLEILTLIDSIKSNKKLQDEISAGIMKQHDLNELKEACDKEIRDIEQYLNKFVAGYFELDLINRLYNTIDPHPDYKQLRFECDFKTKQPRLKVLLNNIEDGKDSIVPNLYFSTAQINILSFCIFLAKALFVKDSEGRSLDCIFIDDPIQALDEINILSVIDLLRNVAFSMDKQIVLTTHDKNFFELLQKKVPDSLFDSRFITLPERGKFSYV